MYKSAFEKLNNFGLVFISKGCSNAMLSVLNDTV